MWQAKNPAFVKGLAVGASVILAVVAIYSLAIPNLLVRHKLAPAIKNDAILTSISPGITEFSGGEIDAAKLAAEPDIVYADAPRIVRTAQLDLLVENLNDSRREIEALTASENGYVESSQLESDRAKLTLKVPTSRFDETRKQLRKLAKRVREETVNARDVSKQYIDTDARLRNLRAEELQFLDILKHARTVPDTLAATKELSEVREQIEETDAELRHLKDQVDLSTIDVTISAETLYTYAVHWSLSSSVKSAGRDAVQALADFADFLLWLLFSLPAFLLWLLVFYVLAMAAWFVLKKVLIPVWKRLFKPAVAAPLAQP